MGWVKGVAWGCGEGVVSVGQGVAGGKVVKRCWIL